MAGSCNPATWRQVLMDGLKVGHLLCSGSCRSSVRTKATINMAFSKELEGIRLSKEGRIGSGGKPSSQKLPWGSVVGQRQWVASSQQPTQYSQTQNFCLLQWRQAQIPYDSFELAVEKSLNSQMCMINFIHRWISCLKCYVLSIAAQQKIFWVAKKDQRCQNTWLSVPVKQAAYPSTQQGDQYNWGKFLAKIQKRVYSINQ